MEILKDSLILLKKEPKVFVPRLITTAVYTLFIFYSAKVTFDIFTGVGNFRDMLILGIFSPILLGIDLVSYGMYPKIIMDYYDGKKINLTGILLETLKSWKILLVFGIIISIFIFIFIGLMSVLYGIALAAGNFAILFLATVFAILILLIFSTASFFVMPVGILEKQGVVNTLRKSIGLSIMHKKDVLNVNIVFMILAIVTIIIATLSEFGGIFTYLAFAVFLIARLFQAVVYTYIGVVNPTVYLKLRG